MFLATTSLSEFWDAQDELLFAGQWCARHDRQDWRRFRHQFLPDPWRDQDRYLEAVERSWELSERLLGELATRLNRALGSSHSLRYWRIILNPWLSLHVQQFLEKHTLVEDALKFYPGLRSRRLDPACFRTPRDIDDFVRLARSDSYNLQLFSQSLSVLLPGSPQQSLPPEPAASTPKGLRRLASAAASRLLSALPLPSGDAVICDLYLTKQEMCELTWKTRLKARPFTLRLPEGDIRPVMDESRLALARIPARNPFEQALIAGLPHNLPALYLEGHAEARRFCLKHLKRTPKVLFSAIGWHSNEAFKFTAAECAARGSQLWAMQHGGIYGFLHHAAGERFERSIADRFYCWGWSSLAEDPKVRDLPHPLLSRTRTPASAAKDELLFTSTVLLFHSFGLSKGQQNSFGLDYIERQARFARALPEDVQRRLVVRLFRDWGWRHHDRLKEAFPQLQLDDLRTPFAQRVRSARLAVFDCPITTFLEALAADVPSILTWNAEAWPFRTQAVPFLDRLREAGIYHESPEAAARQAALVYRDPRAWWDAPRTREAHRSFAKHFAKADPDWARLWVKELHDLTGRDQGTITPPRSTS